MSSNVVICASGLGKAYRTYERPSDRITELLLPQFRRGTDFWALQRIDLTVHAGESVAIIGRNGSGKSTLLQLICGLSQPNTGSVSVRGRMAGLLELGAGFNLDFTGRENVELTASILGLRADEIDARFDSIETFAGIGDYIDRPLREYSSGMYARLAFALCAHVYADVLVIDEILAVGDAAFQQKCTRFLRAFHAGGGTLLLVSHNEASVLALCERAIWLDGGTVQADGPSGDVCRRYATAQQDSGGALKKGGRVPAAPPPAKLVISPPRPVPASSNTFDFDPDTGGETGEALIDSVEFYSAAGTRVASAEVGEKLELRIDSTAKTHIADVVVAFVVRNRIGRPVFSDDTGSLGGGFPAGRSFSASFSFHLPFLQPGDYAVEAFVFAREGRSQRLLAHSLDSHFLSVHSSHVGGGLANIPVIETAIDVLANARDGADVA